MQIKVSDGVHNAMQVQSSIQHFKTYSKSSCLCHSLYILNSNLCCSIFSMLSSSQFPSIQPFSFLFLYLLIYDS
ncbi:hypothetical protein FGO68_gene11416 [Halteria grandinella]|uniref:Uncharacterized protein n=1 Tax=Halteria grandinella TaxID=5974 RepID=A0A8J8P5Z5_HALGN|nr:hypothetical protein FGO68_gene11416 [Halteria grandinella]